MTAAEIINDDELVAEVMEMETDCAFLNGLSVPDLLEKAMESEEAAREHLNVLAGCLKRLAEIHVN